MSLAGVTLETLTVTVHHAEVQAELLSLRHKEPGRTNEVVEQTVLDLRRCRERLMEEVEALRRHGLTV